MNKTYTLKELADIAESTAKDADKNSKESKWGSKLTEKERWGFIWREVTKSILDAIGYEFPKDEEREAFHAWCGSGRLEKSDYDDLFEAWKAGREELRRDQMIAKEQPEAVKPKYHYRGTKLENITFEKEPAWIPWAGGACPLPDTVKRWEIRYSDGFVSTNPMKPSKYYWEHDGTKTDIVAYRVLEG